MAITYGFYNSVNHDRKYDAVQVSMLFDGLIHDGIYANIGDKFQVTPSYGMHISVGTGRAWFNHTWTLNDAPLSLRISDPEFMLNRKDAVVLEVNETTRKNDIKILKGIPAQSPSAPDLTNNDLIHQHLLATVIVAAGVESITAAQIQNFIGTSTTPFVTGVVSSMNIDMFVDQWAAQWGDYLRDRESEWNNYLRDRESEWNNYFEEIKRKWFKFYNEYATRIEESAIDLEETVSETIYNQRVSFISWFNDLQVTLEGNVAANLDNKISILEARWIKLAKDSEIVFSIKDDEGNQIMDSNNDGIKGRIVFEIKQ